MNDVNVADTPAPSSDQGKVVTPRLNITQEAAAKVVHLDSEIVIAEWPKNGRETMRVRIDSFKDQNVIDCRAWYPGNDGLLRPGRGGLTLSVRHLPALADALAKANETAAATGLLSRDDATSASEES